MKKNSNSKRQNKEIDKMYKMSKIKVITNLGNNRL